MTTFILLAIVLTIAAVAVVAVPLLRRSAVVPNPATIAAFSVSGVLIFGAAALYVTLSKWDWRAPAATGDSPQGMVSGLARRLEKDPNDLEGWLMLGRSYAVLEQYPLAVRAYQRADQLANGQNAEALVGMAEALALQDETQLGGKAGELIERALVLDPTSGRAVFYGAVAALRRNELPLARERFSKLLTFNPKGDVRSIIERQIADIDAQLGGPPSGGASAGGSSPGAPATAQANPATPTPAVHVKVTLSAKLSASVPSNASLFVLVRDPRQAGPPLAVKRLTSSFPQTVELTTADSMLPNHTFSAGQLVEVVARVSRSGNPIGSSGDPFGLAAHRVGEDGVVDIVIDHVTP
jgi:cytochrome c-type biogenesis protein CcmH